jgi:hypothetical protein
MHIFGAEVSEYDPQVCDMLDCTRQWSPSSDFVMDSLIIFTNAQILKFGVTEAVPSVLLTLFTSKY